MDVTFDLEDISIDIITRNQQSSGSYVASPSFSTYNYCWLRDGSFTAYSMDLYKRYDSSDRFFDWVDMVISRQSNKAEAAIDMRKKGRTLLNSDYLSTRYKLDGSDIDDEWPNFQLDGYGIWLWALDQHVKATGRPELISKYKKSIDTSIDYLISFWDAPCFDCWQENGDKVHTSTLSCIFGGLSSISGYLKDEKIKTEANKVRQYILDNCIHDGKLVKYRGSDMIDASILWASIPFGVISTDDPVMIETVKEIERKLMDNGGVHRYAGDTYYGGGEWFILASWLGWYYAETGQSDKAVRMRRWIETRVNRKGEMAEQSLEHVYNTDYLYRWKNLWGESAIPLLWSHAMYLVLLKKLNIRLK